MKDLHSSCLCGIVPQKLSLTEQLVIEKNESNEVVRTSNILHFA